MNQKGKYWYRSTVFLCPICGHQETMKERVQGEKPENPYERMVWIIRYDWCDIFEREFSF